MLQPSGPPPSGFEKFLPQGIRLNKRYFVSFLVGILGGIVFTSQLGTSANCVMHFGFSQFDSSITLFVIGTLGAGLISFIAGQLLPELPRKITRVLFWGVCGLLSGMLVILPVAITSAAPPHGLCNPSICAAYDPAAKAQTPEYLIAREGEAVLAKDIDLIKTIYTPDATVINDAEQRTWSALGYYRLKFANEDHCALEHFNLSVTASTDQSVKVCGQSRGTYKLASDPPPCTLSYENTVCADQWTVVRDTDGCLRIQSLSFNNPPS